MFREIIKLAKHTIIYGFGNVATRAIAFLLIPLYTAYLTPEDYGILQICKVVSYILVVIVMMGVNSSMFRVYYNTNDQKERELLINSTMFTFLFFATLILTPLVIFSSNISYLLLGVHNAQILFVLLIFSVLFEGINLLQL